MGNDILTSYLRAIITEHGIESLRNARIANILDDYHVQDEMPYALPILRDIIKRYGEDIIREYGISKEKGLEGVFLRCVQKYHSEGIYDKEKFDLVIGSLAEALGISQLPISVVKFHNAASSQSLSESQLDPLFETAARLVVAQQQGSTSLIQRKLSIGYNRTSRIMDQLENQGILGPAQGVHPRHVLIKDELDLNAILCRLSDAHLLAAPLQPKPSTKDSGRQPATKPTVTPVPRKDVLSNNISTKQGVQISKAAYRKGCARGCVNLVVLLAIIIGIGWIVNCKGNLKKIFGSSDGTNNALSSQTLKADTLVYFTILNEIVDTIRDNKGEIVDMKKKNVADVKVTLAPDTLFLETPYTCSLPSISFDFNGKEVFNKVVKDLQTTHIYRLEKSSTNPHVYYIQREKLPTIEYSGMTSDSHKIYDSDIENFEIFYADKDKSPLSQNTTRIDLEIKMKHVKGSNLSDSIKIKLFDYLKTVKEKQ